MARGGAVLFGVVTGMAVGVVLAQFHLGRHRENLFSPRRLRRFAALGNLAAAGSVESAALLRDYLQWERDPALRRRAGVILRRIESALG
jgi:hypothetical protein